MKPIQVLVVALLAMVFCSADAISAGVEGKYENLEGDYSLQVRSATEVEIDEKGLIFLGTYSIEPDGRLRVVAKVMGTDMVGYYRITKQGLVDEEDGAILYSEAMVSLLQVSRNPASHLATFTIYRRGFSGGEKGIITDVDIRGIRDENLDFQEQVRKTKPAVWFGEVAKCKKTGFKKGYFSTSNEGWRVEVNDTDFVWVFNDRDTASIDRARASRDEFAQTVEKAIADWGLRYGDVGVLSEAEYRDFKCLTPPSPNEGAPLLQESSAKTPATQPDGEIAYTGDSRMGTEVWPFALRLRREESGVIEGEIEWLTLGSLHRVEGSFQGDTLVFEEVEYLRRGEASIGPEYTFSLASDGSLKGTWKYKRYTGTVSMTPAGN